MAEVTMSQWSYRHWLNHATLLSNARARASSNTQLVMLDVVIELACEMFANDAATFDADWFSEKARKGYGYTKNTIPMKGTSCSTTSSRSRAT